MNSPPRAVKKALGPGLVVRSLSWPLAARREVNLDVRLSVRYSTLEPTHLNQDFCGSEEAPARTLLPLEDVPEVGRGNVVVSRFARGQLRTHEQLQDFYQNPQRTYPLC